MKTTPLLLAILVLMTATNAIEAAATYAYKAPTIAYKAPSSYTYTYSTYKAPSTYVYTYTKPVYYSGVYVAPAYSYGGYSYNSGYTYHSNGGTVVVGGAGGGLCCCIIFFIIICVACGSNKNQGEGYETVQVIEHNPGVVEHHTVTVVDNGYGPPPG